MLTLDSAAAFWTGVNAILTLSLAINVSRNRAIANQWVGVPDASTPNESAKRLYAANRAHSNNVEYVPFCLLMIILIEYSSAVPQPLVHVYGALLFLFRVMHAIGMLYLTSINRMRQWGNTLTWVLMLVLSLNLIIVAFNVNT